MERIERNAVTHGYDRFALAHNDKVQIRFEFETRKRELVRQLLLRDGRRERPQVAHARVVQLALAELDEIDDDGRAL